LLAGCQQQMADQPSFRPDQPDANRPLPPGTVARGHLRTDAALFTGRRAGADRGAARPVRLLGLVPLGPLAAVAAGLAEEDDAVAEFPFPVTEDVLYHGYHRYMIYCVVCHDPLGTGRGKIVERGYTQPPSFHIDRLRNVPAGHIFDVVTNGYGSMPEYRQQIPPRDRWAIAAYVRALQLSQHFPVSELKGQMREQWEKQRRPAPAGGRQP
jgi:mono/diheme cytochrome c family protein